MSAPKLSINVNKYALVRNSRERNTPDLLRMVDLVLSAGAHGITVHPRLDQRHVRLDDVPVLERHLRTYYRGIELNVECQPTPELLELVTRVKPDQCTLVPVRPGEVTSDHGFQPGDVARLRPCIEQLHAHGIRVSLFADCVPDHVRALAATGADRIELYTGPYAWAWGTPAQTPRRAEVFAAAEAAREVGLGLNAGHDLDSDNLQGLAGLPGLLEVSIGHAQLCRALEVGTVASVQELLRALGH